MITLTATIEVPSADPIEINRSNIISIDSSIFDRSDLKMPSFGLISNTGSIKFIDTDGTIESYAQNRLLTGGMNVSISLNNTLYKRTQQIASFETEQWNYDNESRVVDVSLTSGLEKLQEIMYEGIPYDFSTENRNFEWLYRRLYEATTTNPKFKMKRFDELDSSTKERISKLYLQYPCIEASNLWAEWAKFCVATQTHIFKNIDGIITCNYLGGN